MITGNARTGSTLLVYALASHPHIVCYRELFHPLKTRIPFKTSGFDEDDPEAYALRENDPVRFLQERVWGPQPDEVRAVGFKYLYQVHSWFPGVDEALAADQELRVIHLIRRNLLRNYLSAEIARMTDQWAVRAPETFSENATVGKFIKSIAQPRRAITRVRQILAQRRAAEERRARAVRPKVTLTVEGCLDAFKLTRDRDRMYAERYAAGHQYLALEYEDFLDDRDAAFERIQRFLGVEPQQLAVRLERQNPEPLSQLIANYDEIAAGLRGTEYEGFLDDETR